MMRRLWLAIEREKATSAVLGRRLEVLNRCMLWFTGAIFLLTAAQVLAAFGVLQKLQ